MAEPVPGFEYDKLMKFNITTLRKRARGMGAGYKFVGSSSREMLARWIEQTAIDRREEDEELGRVILQEKGKLRGLGKYNLRMIAQKLGATGLEVNAMRLSELVNYVYNRWMPQSEKLKAYRAIRHDSAYQHIEQLIQHVTPRHTELVDRFDKISSGLDVQILPDGTTRLAVFTDVLDLDSIEVFLDLLLERATWALPPAHNGYTLSPRELVALHHLKEPLTVEELRDRVKEEAGWALVPKNLMKKGLVQKIGDRYQAIGDPTSP